MCKVCITHKIKKPGSGLDNIIGRTSSNYTAKDDRKFKMREGAALEDSGR